MMKTRCQIICLVLCLLLPACNKNDASHQKTPLEESVPLSDLKTKSDYYQPFAIVNDNIDIHSAKLNNEAIKFSYGGNIEFTENGFYQLITEKKNTQEVNDTFLFSAKTREREASEWGIRAWVPTPFKTVSLGSEDVEIYYPHRYLNTINVPFVFLVKESGIIKSVYCQVKPSVPGDNFNIKRGVGSVNIPATALSGKIDFMVGGKSFSRPISKIETNPIELHGTIDSPVDIPAGSYVKISADLNIQSPGSLTIHEGTIILVDEAVDINAGGPIVITGTAVDPVLITCSRKDKYWGGFITRVPTGTIKAQYSIFCQSGYHNSEGYNYGHLGRQALFYTELSYLELEHCFILDNIGQIFYPQNSTLNLNNIIVQRAPTGGQINNSILTLKNSVFTDFPDDSDIFLDEDNDALYLSASDANIENTTFMFAKDDGLDSGDSEGGEINVTNCRFESCFHEGAALSSGDLAVKNHTFKNCVFSNCGQGLELGFSSPNHSVTAVECEFLNNGVGIRYGDNYDWSLVEGRMIVKNSFSLNNDKDVWNMVRMNWSPKLENMSFENTKVSKYCIQYPHLEVISH
jgi:hypothetical protein